LSAEERAKLGMDSGSYLEERVSVNVRKSKRDSSATRSGLFGAKMGPREARRGSAKYDGLKLSEEEERRLFDGSRRALFGDTVHHSVKKKRHRRVESLVGSKKGPVEIGKEDYDGIHLDDEHLFDDDNGDIFSEKTHIITKKKWHRFDDDNDDDKEVEEEPGAPRLGLRKSSSSHLDTEPSPKSKRLKPKARRKRAKSPRARSKPRGTDSETDDAVSPKKKKKFSELARLKGAASEPVKAGGGGKLKRTQSASALSKLAAVKDKERANRSRRKKQEKKRKKKKRKKSLVKKRVSMSMGDGRYQFEYDSDAEYIEAVRRNCFDDDDDEKEMEQKSHSKRNSLVLEQSESSSPKKAVMATAASMEIAHFVHDRGNDSVSDDDSIGNSSSLNAISDDDDSDSELDDQMNKRWI